MQYEFLGVAYQAILENPPALNVFFILSDLIPSPKPMYELGI